MKFDLNDKSIIQVLLDFGSKEVPVGRLATKNGRIYFEYDADFLDKGLEISPLKLPLRRGLIENEDQAFDGLFGVFNDSLPDGWGKLLVDRSLMAQGIPPQSLTPLDRLSIVGEYGMGALIYRPGQKTGIGHETQVDLDTIADGIDEVLEGEATDVIDELRDFGGSSAGARPKIVVGYDKVNDRLISSPTNTDDRYEDWLIKFPSSMDPDDIGRIEYAYALMAGSAMVYMPETKLFKGRRGKDYFGVKRFDRGGGKRYHMHTAAGLLHSSHRFPSLDYKDLMKATGFLTQDQREIEKVFRLCCFNVLAHNRDDHSKNFSFLMDEFGKWRFAPAYDLTFSFGPGGHQSTMVLGEGLHPGTDHLLKLAGEFDIKEADSIISAVDHAIRAWPEFARQANVTDPSTNLIWKKLNY